MKSIRSSGVHGGFGRLLRRTLGPVYRAMPVRLRRAVRAARLKQIVRSGAFGSEEPEYLRLSEWLAPGDVAFDVGANFGSYSLRMSQIVGACGRVYAFEPVPQTFAMLTSVLDAADCRNVSALNLACSNVNGLVTMSVPDDPLSGENLYQASIRDSGPALTRVVCARIDDLPLPADSLKVVKIDAEGHDAEVIEGMWTTISRSMPVLIVEHPPVEITARLKGLGYELTKQAGSPNAVFIPLGRSVLANA